MPIILKEGKMMSTIIGISGKIGSGKNYLAEKLMQEFETLGYSTAEGSFAAGLRSELNRMIQTIKVEILEGSNGETILNKLSHLYKLEHDEAELLYSCMVNDIIHVDGLNANSRTESIRRALQILGTDVRRKHNNDYWVELFFKHVPEADFVLVTDVRFPNEADGVVESGGVLIRIDMPQHVIDERISQRDGLKYSESALNHPSEIALDDYEKFVFKVGETFDAKTLAQQIINYVDIPRRIAEQGV